MAVKNAFLSPVLGVIGYSYSTILSIRSVINSV